MKLKVCVGPGGVGKTTVSATLALQAAKRGERALVLTIDPARRLAQALGLDGLSDEIRAVALPDTMAATGTLSAAMLDTQKSFDSLLERIATDPEYRGRIFENRIYRSFSRSLARSHAYVAVERLYDVVTSGDFDFIVLDTPPTRSALEILDAPGRLVRFLEGRVIRWFLGDSTAKPAKPKRLGRRSGGPLIGLLAQAIGGSVIEEIVEFLTLLAPLRSGFADRADYVQRLFAGPETDFVLVAAPDPMVLDDAAYLRDGLLERQISIQTMVFNRAFTPEPRTQEPLREPSPPPPGAPPVPLPPALAATAARLVDLRTGLVQLDAARDPHIQEFIKPLPSAVRVLRLPRLAHEPCDLLGLQRLGLSL